MSRTDIISARVGKDERLLALAAAARRGEPLSAFIARAVRRAALKAFSEAGEARDRPEP